MFDDRLPAKLWVEALIRRAQIAGAAAFVLQKGDAERGDLLIKVSSLDGAARLYAPRTSIEGARVFRDLSGEITGESEIDIDAYVSRARARDADLWVLEIEDRDGRHFLTEPIDNEP